MKFIGSIFLISFSILYTNGADYCVDEQITGKWQQRSIPKLCCGITDEQWKLIAWYFLRVESHIKVTEVIRQKIETGRLSSTFTTDFVRDLFDHLDTEYLTYRVDYSHRDEMLDEKQQDRYHQPYRWHPELSKHSKNTTHIIEHATEVTIRRKISKKKSRECEPDFGAIVLAEDIEIFDHYLNGETRHPFKNKRAIYILIVYKEIDGRNWDRLASSVLSKIWKDHGILNAIIFSTCKHDNVR